jgi:hypothetical protein
VATPLRFSRDQVGTKGLAMPDFSLRVGRTLVQADIDDPDRPDWIGIAFAPATLRPGLSAVEILDQEGHPERYSFARVETDSDGTIRLQGQRPFHD